MELRSHLLISLPNNLLVSLSGIYKLIAIESLKQMYSPVKDSTSYSLIDDLLIV